MQPRLKTSKKWTAFPDEFCTQIEEVFKQNFAEQLANGQLTVEGRIYAQELMLRVGYIEKGRLKQANFEVSINYNADQQDTVDRIHNCIDAAASMMSDYFEHEGDVDFPYLWKEFDFQNQKLYIQFTTENSSLEAQANALLGETEEGFIQEEGESEDALTRAEIIPDEEEEYEDESEVDEDEADEDDDQGPRMFGGQKPKKKTQLH